MTPLNELFNLNVPFLPKPGLPYLSYRLTLYSGPGGEAHRILDGRFRSNGCRRRRDAGICVSWRRNETGSRVGREVENGETGNAPRLDVSVLVVVGDRPAKALTGKYTKMSSYKL